MSVGQIFVPFFFFLSLTLFQGFLWSDVMRDVRVALHLVDVISLIAEYRRRLCRSSAIVHRRQYDAVDKSPSERRILDLPDWQPGYMVCHIDPEPLSHNLILSKGHVKQ